MAAKDRNQAEQPRSARHELLDSAAGPAQMALPD